MIAQISMSVLVYQRSGSPFLTALALALGFLPSALSGTLLSGIADRYPVRRTLVSCNLLSAAFIGLAVIPWLPVPVLLALVFAEATVSPVFSSVRVATLPEFLADDRYVLGRSVLRIVSQTMQVAGFAIGGALLLLVSPRGGLLIDTSLLLCSAALLRFGTPYRPPLQAKTASAGRKVLVRDSLGNVRALLVLPRVRALMILWWLGGMFTVMPEALAVPYSHQIDITSAGLGLLMAAPAIGTIGGELAVGALLGPSTRARIVLPMAACALLPLLGYAVRPGLAAALVILVAVGATGAYFIGLDQWFIDAVPKEFRGVAFSVVTAGLMLMQGAGMSLVGAVAQWARPNLVIFWAAIVGTAVVIPAVRAVRRTSQNVSREQVPSRTLTPSTHPRSSKSGSARIP